MPVAQDFVKGLDFTALVTANGSQHNQLIEQATPESDRGLVLTTTDTALDTPDVPNANTTTKWKRYLWKRIPHATAEDLTPLIYGWNDDATADGTFLKWIQLIADFASVEAIADAALAAAQSAQASANAAIATAGVANTAATTALSNANDAVATAEAVAADATNALNAATAAQTAATAANDTASDALAVATAANANATNALNQVQADRLNKQICITEEKNTNVTAGASVIGAVVRQINTVKNDGGANVVSLAAGIVTLKAGNYKVRASAPGFSVGGHQLYFVKNSDDTTLIIGSTVYQNNLDVNVRSELEGFIVVTEDTAYRLDHYFSSVHAKGQGREMGIGPIGSLKETYAILTLEKLN